MDNKNLKEKVITPITDALTKLTDNVASPVNAVGLIPDNILPKIEWPRDYTLADYACEKIIERINEFEANLPDDMQAGGKFITFGSEAFAIDSVTYQNPNILIFSGTTAEGETVQLIQHTSQLNLLLLAVKRNNPEEPRRKIGYL